VFGLKTLALADLARYKRAQPHRIKHLLPISAGSVLMQEIGEKAVAPTHSLGQIAARRFCTTKVPFYLGRQNAFDPQPMLPPDYPQGIDKGRE